MLIFDQIKRGDGQLRAIAIGVAAGLGLLLLALWYVQVVSAQRYRADLLDQSFRIVRVPAIRGKILDRNGWALADNRPSYDLDLYFEELRPNFRREYNQHVLADFRRANPKLRPVGALDELLQSQARYDVVSNLMRQVSALVEEPQVLDEKQFTKHYNNLRSLPFPLLRDLTPTQVARYVERAARMPSLALEVQAMRQYPYGQAAAHLLGYLQREDTPSDDEDISFQFRLPDYVGATGIERAFDQQLRGKPGVKSVLVNNLQYRQAEEIWTAPQPGQNVVLTIDLNLQQATEHALKKAMGEARGAAVVMDCRDGDILAMASEPSFDPNLFVSRRLSPEDWARLTDEKMRPLINRAAYGAYPPGSTFKIIVSLAGLEAGLLKTNEVFHAGNGYKIDGHGHEWRCTAPAGEYDFDHAFYRSCNCYFIDHGLKIGFERIVDLGRRFGLGQRTGLSTHLEAAGYFPDPNDKIKKDGSRWMPGDTANLCIGQGDITVTPLQMAVMTAAVANGGTVLEPRLVDRIEPQEPDAGGPVIHFPGGQVRERLSLNPANLQTVRDAMLQDVEHKDERGKLDGTGHLAGVEGLRVCGKTGTAQVMEGKIVKSWVTWFASFAPFENPRYVVVVTVEADHGSGATICAPVAHAIYEAILKRERTPALRNPSSLASR
jgi:penicillin-binding protein 2